MTETSGLPLQTNERSPLMELLALALPTVAQMASYTVMQFLDAWMLARASHNIDDPTAVGNAGMFAFALISFGMGVLWVVNTLVSQSYGRKTYHECGQYLWQGIWFAFAFSAVLVMFIPGVAPLFRGLGHEPALLAREAVYLKIVLGASLFKLVGTAFSQFLLAVNRPGMVFSSTIIGVSSNALAAWIMVFGTLGCPKLGVVGTAWAQNVGVLVETSCLIIFAMLPAIRRTYNATDWKLRWPAMKTLLFVGAPAGLQIIGDVLAWSLFGMWIMARFGTAAMAGNNFMFQYMKVSFMPAFGISVAVTALVGRYIGMGKPDIAEKRAHLAFKVCAVYMLTCGLTFFFGRHALISIFSTDPLVLQYGSTLLIFAAIYQLFDALYITYNGALRGAGDTFVPAVVTAGLNWSITIGVAYCVSRFFPQFGVAGPWTSATVYGGTLGTFIFFRFKRGAWRNIHLEHDSNPAADSVTFSNLQLTAEK
jgi:multidrug resistance protein, MATE family